MKYIAFGTGEVYKSYCNCDIKKNIVAYTNNKDTNINKFEGKPIIEPSQINQYMYDYVIIYSTKYFEEIFNQLVNDLKVSENKIISFWEITPEGEHIALQRRGQNIIEIIKKMQWTKILDYTAFFSNLFFNSNDIFIENKVNIDAFVSQQKKIFPIFLNLYENVFYSGTCSLTKYDAIVCSYLSCKDKELEENLPDMILENTKYLLMVLPYSYDYNKLSFVQYGNIIYTQYKAHGKFVIIDLKPNKIKKNIKIYAVSHKEFIVPDDSVYEPIYVGEYGIINRFVQSDNRGDNIAKYNLYINETTALYWIWKHSREDYVGICHYRRFFLQDEDKNINNILNKCFVEVVLDKYDIILPQPVFIDNIKEQLKRHVDSRAFEEGWSIILDLIKKKQPDYLDSFEYFFNCAKIMYPYNMFVTRKEIINDYCIWLFSFILDAVKASDFHVYDNYSRRIIGFFIERLFNVWLLKQNLKIIELPIILLEDV